MSTTSNPYGYSSQNAQDQKLNPEQAPYEQQAAGGGTGAFNTATSYLPGTGNSGAVGTEPASNYRHQQPHVGGVGELGTGTHGDAAQLPEERMNPNQMGNQLSGSHRLDQAHAGQPAFNDKSNDAFMKRDGGQSGLAGAASHYEAHPNLYDADANATGRGHNRANEGTQATTELGSLDADHYERRHDQRSTASNTAVHRDTAGATDDDAAATAAGVDRGKLDQLAGAMKNAPKASQYDHEAVPPPDAAGFPTGKPSALDKLKGSVEVTLGKLKHDEDQIEQGKMLKETGKAVNIQEEIRRGVREDGA